MQERPCSCPVPTRSKLAPKPTNCRQKYNSAAACAPAAFARDGTASQVAVTESAFVAVVADLLAGAANAFAAHAIVAFAGVAAGGVIVHAVVAARVII